MLWPAHFADSSICPSLWWAFCAAGRVQARPVGELVEDLVGVGTEAAAAVALRGLLSAAYERSRRDPTTEKYGTAASSKWGQLNPPEGEFRRPPHGDVYLLKGSGKTPLSQNGYGLGKVCGNAEV